MGLGDDESPRRQREDGWPVEGIQKLEEEKSLRAAYCGSHTKIPLTTERKKHGYGGV